MVGFEEFANRQMEKHRKTVDNACKEALSRAKIIDNDLRMCDTISMELVKKHGLEFIRHQKHSGNMDRLEVVVLTSKTKDLAKWLEVNGIIISDSIEYLD